MTDPIHSNVQDAGRMSPISIGILILLSIFALQPKAEALDRLIETTTENFYPIRITVQVGDQIQWNNLDMVSHEIYFTGNPTHGSDESIHFFLPKGKTVSMTPEKPGRYPYKCRWHGMFGEIEVRDLYHPEGSAVEQSRGFRLE